MFFAAVLKIEHYSLEGEVTFFILTVLVTFDLALFGFSSSTLGTNGVFKSLIVCAEGLWLITSVIPSLEDSGSKVMSLGGVSLVAALAELASFVPEGASGAADCRVCSLDGEAALVDC